MFSLSGFSKKTYTSSVDRTLHIATYGEQSEISKQNRFLKAFTGLSGHHSVPWENSYSALWKYQSTFRKSHNDLPRKPATHSHFWLFFRIFDTMDMKDTYMDYCMNTSTARAAHRACLTMACRWSTGQSRCTSGLEETCCSFAFLIAPSGYVKHERHIYRWHAGKKLQSAGCMFTRKHEDITIGAFRNTTTHGPLSMFCNGLPLKCKEFSMISIHSSLRYAVSSPKYFENSRCAYRRERRTKLYDEMCAHLRMCVWYLVSSPKHFENSRCA